MDVNVTANWRLIRTLDPLLRVRRGARAVRDLRRHDAAAAVLGRLRVSKAALEALVKTYALEMAHD